MKYKSLAVSNPDELIFGDAPLKVKTNRGLTIGGGQVYPEVKFTLPPMEVSVKTLSEVRKLYAEIAEGVLEPLGNVAAAAADLWSNESVQHIKLLSGMAPVAYYEQLEYDVR
jgi:hypothetical protein